MAARRMRPILSQVIVVREGSVLLVRWKTGEFKGRKTALLGLVSQGEEIVDGAARIAKESVGLDLQPERLSLRAIFSMRDAIDPPEPDAEVPSTHEEGEIGFVEYSEHEFLYEATVNELLDPQETSIVVPEWVPIDEIPYDQMPEDDREWYPRVLSGEHMLGSFQFEKETCTKSQYWSVPRIVQDVLAGTPNGRLDELKISEVKELAVCSGVKVPSVGWRTCAPPLASKPDIIRKLEAKDVEYQNWRDAWFHSS
ncbi:hypothetical protein AAMO2058_000812800 [Amorphochlora amoebiformis]